MGLFDTEAAPKVTAGDHQDDLIEQAWRLAAEALQDGSLTLRGGRVVTLAPESLLRHVQWLANQRTKRPKSVPRPKDAFQLKPTQ